MSSDSRDTVKVGGGKSVSVDDTAGGTQVLAENTARRSFLISNEGSEDVLIRFGGDPSFPSTGHKLAAGGNLLYDKRAPQDEIKAITNSSSTTLFVSEGVT